jgi:hypothetical protein
MGKLCACLGITLLVIVIIACIIPFVVQTPDITVTDTKVACDSTLSALQCAALATSTGIPLQLTVVVNNPNILGADVSAAFKIYDANPTGTGTVLCEDGTIPKTRIGSRSKSTAVGTCYVKLPGAANLISAVITGTTGSTYLARAVGTVTIYLGALTPDVEFDETFTLTQP